MKNLFIFCLIFAAISLSAQKPEKVYPNAREHKSIPYLKEQAAAWKKEITQNPKSTEAWYNYYYANRNLNFNDTTDKRTVEEKSAAINQLIDEMGKNIPNSYEYNLCKWMNGGWNMKLLPFLKKAEELGPERPEHVDYSMVFAEMERDITKRDLYAKKKFEAGQFSTGMLYYNYNVLIGLAPNSILLTAGDNDTFPIWYLQSLGIRRDVSIVHLHLINVPEYSEKIFKDLGIEKWHSYEGSDMDSLNSYKIRFRADLIHHIAANKKNLPVYVALTAPLASKCADNVKDNLYLTGLAYQYSKSSVDNIAVLKKNFEQLYALDYIEKAFYEDISLGLVSMINGNYVVPMLKLYEHYKLSGDKQKEEWMKKKLLALSAGRSDEKEIKKHLSVQ